MDKEKPAEKTEPKYKSLSHGADDSYTGKKSMGHS